MSLKAGIIGLPNVGKSTLFKALTKQNILVANYPFATIDPNVGVVAVPDLRLDFLYELCQPEKLTPAIVEFVDIAGLVKGASTGEGLGNKFLANIREADVICEVVRCFQDRNVTHVSGEINPIGDIEIIATELMLADLETVSNRLSKVHKKPDLESKIETMLLDKLKEGLEKNMPIRQVELDEKEQLLLKSFNFLTAKKIIYVCNIGEDEINQKNHFVEQIEEYAEKEEANVVVISAKVEAELVDLEERAELLKVLNIEEAGLDQLIRSVYHLLGLKTFFTIGKEEVRAWTFKDGMKAPACAGIIHTDFEKGFIKAEIMSYQDLVEYKSEKKVQEMGKKRLEGKSYVMQDGDICHFRFN